MKTNVAKFVAPFAALMFMFGGSVQAGTITLTKAGSEFGTLSWSDPNVELTTMPDGAGFALQPWSGNTELNDFNSAFGTSYTKLFKEDFNDAESQDFEIGSSVFSLKFGQKGGSNLAVAYFVISGIDTAVNYPVSFTWVGKSRMGAGLSHSASPVPLPAAAYLFGSALLGMAGIGYRRNKKQA